MMDPNDARQEIIEHLMTDGPGADFEIGRILSETAMTYGSREADYLMEDLGLYDMFGYGPEDE